MPEENHPIEEMSDVVNISAEHTAEGAEQVGAELQEEKIPKTSSAAQVPVRVALQVGAELQEEKIPETLSAAQVPVRLPETSRLKSVVVQGCSRDQEIEGE